MGNKPFRVAKELKLSQYHRRVGYYGLPSVLVAHVDKAGCGDAVKVLRAIRGFSACAGGRERAPPSLSGYVKQKKTRENESTGYTQAETRYRVLLSFSE